MNSTTFTPVLTHMPEIHGVCIDQLVTRYGSPLFVFSEQTLRQSYARLLSAFQSRYPNVALAWSYKTNYLQAICQLFQNLGARAEIVSRMEYEMASTLGVPPTNMIFNGPAKSFAMLEQSLLAGVFIQIDHANELTNILAIAEKMQTQFSVGLRLHIPFTEGSDWSRFGFDLQSGDAWQAVQLLATSRYVQLTGLHGHLGTMITRPIVYEQAVQKMAEFARKIELHTKFHISKINLGGGFPSQSQPKIRSSTAESNASIDEYASRICQAMLLEFPHTPPQLILEPGRSLVDTAGYLITTVCGCRKTPTNTAAYILDAGLNVLPQASLCQYPLAITKQVKNPLQHTHLYGPLCMNTDILATNAMLPPMECGEQIIFQSVGAYNVTQSMQFIEYRPNIVWITKQGQVELIREAETLADIRRLERLPKHLS